MIVEKWKKVEGYSDYEVSNLGRVLSRNTYFKHSKILSYGKLPSGYKTVCLSKNGERKNLSVSRLVAKAFIPNPLLKKEVNHKNGIKIDNCYLNLEWVTPSENILHAFHYGLLKPRSGEQCTLSRLKENDVISIRKMKENNPQMTYVEIGKIFKTTPSAIRKIILRHQWKHI